MDGSVEAPAAQNNDKILATAELKIARHLLRESPKNLDLKEEKEIIDKAVKFAKLKAWKKTRAYAEDAANKIRAKKELLHFTQDLMNKVMVDIEDVNTKFPASPDFLERGSALYDQLAQGRVQETYEMAMALSDEITAILKLHIDCKTLEERIVFFKENEIDAPDVSSYLSRINDGFQANDLETARMLIQEAYSTLDEYKDRDESNGQRARVIIAEIHGELAHLSKSQVPDELNTYFSEAVELYKAKNFVRALEMALKAKVILDGVRQGNLKVLEAIEVVQKKIDAAKAEKGLAAIDFVSLQHSLEAARGMMAQNDLEMAKSYTRSVGEQLEASKRPFFLKIKSGVKETLKTVKIELYNYDKAGLDISKVKDIVVEVSKDLESAEQYSEYGRIEEKLNRVTEFIREKKTEFELLSNPPKYISYKLKEAREKITVIENAGIDVSRLSSVLEEHRGVFSRAVSDTEINDLREKIDPFLETVSKAYEKNFELNNLREDIEDKLDDAIEKIDALKGQGYETKRLWTELKNKESISKMAQSVKALKLAQAEIAKWLEDLDKISILKPNIFAKQEKLRNMHCEINKAIMRLRNEGEVVAEDLTGFKEKADAFKDITTDSQDELDDMINTCETFQKELEDVNNRILDKRKEAEKAKEDIEALKDTCEELVGHVDITGIQTKLQEAKNCLESQESALAAELVDKIKAEIGKIHDYSSADVEVRLDTEDLDPNVWEQTTVTITNTGLVSLKNISMTIEGPAEIRRFKPVAELGLGEETDIQIGIIFRGGGEVPLDIWISALRGFDDTKIDIHKDMWVHVKSEEAPGSGEEEEEEGIEWESDEDEEKRKAIELIKELAGMKDAGIITVEEFETKKKELLSKI